MTIPHKAGTALVLSVLAAALSGCGLHGKPKVERTVRREGIAPSARPPSEESGMRETPDGSEGGSIVAPGIVEPWDGQVELSAHESGWIARILVREGDVVREGQLLAVLEDATQRHAVDLARAELAEATARADYARSYDARVRRLRGDGAIAENDAERAASDALVQQAAADRAEAGLRLAEANLASRRITAARDGTVLLSRFHAGEFYQPGTGPLFVLGDMTRLRVRLEVDEVDASEVSLGARCLLVSDGGQRLAAGTVARVAPKMGRRVLPLESPTARADVRVREVFVEVPATAPLVPGQRVWGHTPRDNSRIRT